MAELQSSELLKYQQLLNGNFDYKVKVQASGVFYGAVVALLVAVGGTALVGANCVAVWNSEYAWDDDKPSKIIVERDMSAYQIWTLKNGTADTYVLLSAYQEKLVNDCIEALRKYFPEKLENIDVEQLRNFIAINLPQ